MLLLLVAIWFCVCGLYGLSIVMLLILFILVNSVDIAFLIVGVFMLVVLNTIVLLVNLFFLLVNWLLSRLKPRLDFEVGRWNSVLNLLFFVVFCAMLRMMMVLIYRLMIN